MQLKASEATCEEDNFRSNYTPASYKFSESFSKILLISRRLILQNGSFQMTAGFVET